MMGIKRKIRVRAFRHRQFWFYEWVCPCCETFGVHWQYVALCDVVGAHIDAEHPHQLAMDGSV